MFKIVLLKALIFLKIETKYLLLKKKIFFFEMQR